MRASRAAVLAKKHPEAAEVLHFLAEVFRFVDAAPPPAWADLAPMQRQLCEKVRQRAPQPLREVTVEDGAIERYFNNPDPADPGCFYARAVLECWVKSAAPQQQDPAPNECPRCGHAPQLGVLQREGEGYALSLACSLCRYQWRFRRGTCPQCGETDAGKIEFYTAESHPQAQTQCCQSCESYLHLLLPERDPELIPEVDELAFLPLDAWAAGRGLQKVWPNLAGI